MRKMQVGAAMAVSDELIRPAVAVNMNQKSGMPCVAFVATASPWFVSIEPRYLPRSTTHGISVAGALYIDSAGTGTGRDERCNHCCIDRRENSSPILTTTIS
jgi:hypothetical protein